MYRIAIVNSSSFGKYFPEHIERLKNVGDVERFTLPGDLHGKELADKLMGFNIIVASVTPFYDKEFFEYKDETLLITRHGIGYNNIDIKSATEKGTIVTKVPGIVEREAVAETAVALLMTVIRKIREASLTAREGKWEERAKFIGWEVKDKIVGIIGYGNIGSRVGEILKNGFNAKIIAYDPNIPPEVLKEKGAEPVSLEELIRNSDIISLNASLNEKSRHMISDKEFSMMKDNVIIINTARGELMDEEALIRAIKSGKVAGVGLDVMKDEPPDPQNPLLHMENVVVTPHIAAYTYECLKGMGDKVVADVERVVNQEIPEEIINKEVLERLPWIKKS
ncbi:hydroxyacid dehydrogenase [Dictyoglomus thermophilum]|uniref:Hydroxyacid dehydrogenase n=2 Tax=Dictyoglomus thermophilum TaxID=14 RepID=A0A7V3ZJY8_DICTH|nr:D-isomer specific 2-hydroxyacid dehydrogenase family protein [Dictyoglomus thermophilum]TYT24098.1 hydroxyacid dehydrogenase [Dictyoglomus thermophilum]